ncbi:MAG: transposase, partial [Candidatus Ratteibacteria bacterium]
MIKVECPRCSGKKFWKIRRRKLKCRNCLYEFRKREYPLNLSRYEWKKFLKWFLISGRVKTIMEEADFSHYKTLQCCELVRMCMARDVSEFFEGIVEVDETYIGGNWRNKNKGQKKHQEQSKRGRGTTRQPILGILCR